MRTISDDAVASSLGTVWVMTQTCAGTLVRVSSGVVSVRDRRRGTVVRVTSRAPYLVGRRAARR